MTLAYAVTNHAAQGVSVDRGRPLAERGTSLEALYPQATRGKSLNVIYLETDIDPDPHHPQRERDTAIAAMGRMAENDAGELTAAATTVRDNAALEARSMLTLAEHYDRIAAGQGHSRHAAIAIEKLGRGGGGGVGVRGAVGADARGRAGRPRRRRDVRRSGGDVAARGRPRAVEGAALAPRGAARAPHPGDAARAARRGASQRAPGVGAARRTAPRPGRAERGRPGGLPRRGRAARPRAHPRARRRGRRRPAGRGRGSGSARSPTRRPNPPSTPPGSREAGQVAAYREWRGIPDDQTSIGQAPPPAQQLAHELWLRAAEAGAGDPRVVDWRKASDQQLRETIAAWEREQAWAPAQVSPERGEALALAHDANNDAVLGRARLAVMAPDDPERERLELYVEAHEVMAEQAAGLAGGLDGAYDARQAWWEDTREQREAAYGAEAELARRGLPLRHEPEPEPEPAARARPRRRTNRRPQVAPARRRVGRARARRVPGRTARLRSASSTRPRPRDGAEEIPSGHDRFLERLVGEHQRALDEVDPDGRLDPTAREAALRARNYERFLQRAARRARRPPRPRRPAQRPRPGPRPLPRTRRIPARLRRPAGARCLRARCLRARCLRARCYPSPPNQETLPLSPIRQCRPHSRSRGPRSRPTRSPRPSRLSQQRPRPGPCT